MSPRRFALPDLGEGLTEAEVVRWMVEVGDEVAVDQPVVEMETAKAVVEVPCPFAGRVAELHAEPGEVVAVGAPLISVAAVETSASAEGRREDSGAVLVGYGTGALPRGAAARAESPTFLAEGPTSSAAARARSANVEGRTVSAQANGSGTNRMPVVSPLVRRIAREHGINAAVLPGTGEGGLVLRRDVEAAIAYRRGRAEGYASSTALRAGTTGAVPPPSAATPVPAPRLQEEAERIPMRGVQRAMAEHLSRSRREIPDATVWVDVDATELLAARAAINAADPQRPVSLLALLARFCVLGLGRFPALNSSVDAERGEVVRYRRVHLGFAAQTPRGLVVPVVHGAESLHMRALSSALAEATAAARAGTLGPERLTGGTFTVNNYGVFGVDGSAPIINHPEAAMVGMGCIAKRPWVVETASGDELVPRRVTTLTLAFDHRVCDGAEAGGFLRFVADCVERPQALLGEV